MARAARDAGIAGLAFLRGIPGAIGGALRMNAGAYGGETKDVLVEARGVDRTGQRPHLHAMPTWALPTAIAARPTTSIFTEALFQGRAGEPAAIAAEMDEITEKREATQPPQEDRRLDLQEPAGQQGLAADRRRRLPRPDASAARRSPSCTATS